MKLKAAYETEVFFSKAEYITIKQEDIDARGNDVLVMLTPSQAHLVAAELIRLADEHDGSEH